MWEKRLLELLVGKVGGLTPGALSREMRNYFPALDRAALHHLIKRLVRNGRLVYALRLGSTRIALGDFEPLRVSERIYLTSAGHRWLVPSGSVCVRLVAGPAFGGGDHPTTCMMLRALEQVLTRGGTSRALAALRVLDVGTGNGVLALAALMLGVGAAVGVDIDPQACHEARLNADQNGVADRFTVIAGSVQAVEKAPFDVVLANLRPPTLAGLLPVLGSLLTDCGWLVLSGFRPDEQPGLKKLLPGEMRVMWQESDRDWAAMVIRQG
jgi:ribosomal protein L11 methyltransferase